MEKSVSIVILSFNRPEAILRNVSEILIGVNENVELIVVDNCSDTPVSQVLGYIERVNIIRLERNTGVAGRNIGISAARSEIVITLDDDVFGLTQNDIFNIVKNFAKNKYLGALNFKVIDDVTSEQINWCHHRKIEEWSDNTFSTYEISEGAVALRRAAFIECGMYPEYFFISHEGPDLALRMMNIGYDIIYAPKITVRHAHAQEGRPSWRRYYYDSRNIIWLAVRCYPFGLGMKRLFIDLGALLIYSIRDGYVRYWVKGVKDGVMGIRRVIKDRVEISRNTVKRYKLLESENPSFLYMVKKRLFKKSIDI